MSLSSKDLDDLRYAKTLLENPSLGIKLFNVVGTPIEKGLELLPANWSAVVDHATRNALQKALDVAIRTMNDHGVVPPRDMLHKIAATITGAVGGAMGLPGLAIELPISTMVILRSIADVARSEGELITTLPAKLACIEVFALGGRSRTDDATESSYFAVRSALARAVTEAADFIAEKGIVEGGAPAVVRLIAQIASRFDVAVSEKVAAQAVPIVGAAGGAVINLLFVDHFQNMARGHFTVRRLERQHGEEAVRAAYGRLRLTD
jgi:hypothetical protein